MFFSIDNIIIALNETLAHLEIQHVKKKFIVNKSKYEYELQLFIKMELWKKEEVSSIIFINILYKK